MKLFRAAVLLSTLSGFAALLAPSAYAQSNMPDINLIPEKPSKTAEEIEREERLQKAYRDSLRKIPDGKASNDPWGSMRGTAEPKAQGKARTRAN